MYVPVGDITDFLDGDDFYSSMAENFAAGDGFRDRYAAAAAANIIGAENQFKIDLALDALNQGQDGRDGDNGFGILNNLGVQSAIGEGIQGLFDSGSSDVVKDFTSLGMGGIGGSVPSTFDATSLFGGL